jgi:hypothetical protein
VRSYDRLTLVACAAGLDAAAAAGWAAADLAGPRTALALGTAFGAHATNEEYYQGVLGRAAVSPRLFTYTLPSSPLGELSIHCRQTGPQQTFCAGWTSGAAALHAAAAHLAAGRADRALCLGADVPGATLLPAIETLAAEPSLPEVGLALALVPASTPRPAAATTTDATTTSPSSPPGAPPALPIPTDLAGVAAAFAPPSLSGQEASARVAACLLAALADAAVPADGVDLALVAAPRARASAAAAALAHAGIPAAARPDARARADAAFGAAMGAAPIAAAAALAAAPAASWRVATVVSLCYSGAASALVFTR